MAEIKQIKIGGTVYDVAAVNGLKTYSRAQIGTSPNFDNPGINGFFEVRSSSETTGETGTKPFNSFGPILSLKTPDDIAMLQIAGTPGNYYIRAKQAGNVTMSGVPWNRIWIQGDLITGAVWNDYAEFRICNEDFKPGQVVLENGDDTLSVANQRLQRGCSVVSDTFGFVIGETDEAKCPIAVSGRVLAYGYESREEFKKHIGWPVCSGPNGTVSIMTEEEEEKYPSRIIGTISAVPDYETWGTGNVEVNNRIWIKVK